MYRYQGMSEKSISKLFTELDLDSDGVISPSEFSLSFMLDGDPRLPVPELVSVDRYGVATILWNVEMRNITNLTMLSTPQVDDVRGLL